MASKGGRRKGKPGGRPVPAKSEKSDRSEPAAETVAARRTIAPQIRRRGQGEVGAGVALLIGAGALAMTSDGEALSAGRFLLVYALAIVGALAIAAGGSRLDPRAGGPPRRDSRRWIYGGLALLFAVVYALLMWKVIPNRLPSAMLHLATVPVFTLLMAIGTLVGCRFGWWLGVVGGSIVLLSTIVLIARILASAAFLAGVYGAFGKAASTFALVSVALIVELVGILPICQVKFLMSRAGRRTYGV